MDNSKLQLVIDDVLDLSYFGNTDEFPLHTFFEQGEGRLLTVTGENASGKSFVARVIDAYCKHRIKTLCMRFSMEGRTQSGNIGRGFMYGDEDHQSTGVNSVNNLIGAVHNCRVKDKEHFVIFDEPDIGLAESYQSAVGKYLAQFVSTLPELTLGVVVITHSRTILRELLPLGPHHIRCGDDQTLKSFVEEGVAPRSIEELLALPTHGGELFKRVAQEMKG